MRLTDQKIVDALIKRDGQVTHDFFFVWCRPLLYSLIRRVFDYEVDYDELVNELYIHLMDDDARRLRTFSGRSSVYQWLKSVALRFFIEKRDKIIENKAGEPLYGEDEPREDPVPAQDAKSDLQKLLKMMPDDRYRYVLEQHYLLDVEYEKIAAALDTSPANVYNIKKRALAKLTVIVLNDGGYEK